jgi:hypothetical protein
MAAPAPALPTRKACALHMFLERRRRCLAEFVEGLMAFVATCRRNKAWARGICFLRSCDYCCCIPDPVTRAEITRHSRDGWEKPGEHARKKSVGRGSDRRCVSSPLGRGLGWWWSIRSWKMLGICVYFWTALFWIDCLAAVERETVSPFVLPCLFAARVLSCIAGCE